ncbi:MAG TPA: TetR/AcrR family transcriptional regulator, partial [Burkholderiaceae bacterium]|nr:TetR/AcrR family transcriptional regulator [Burkholderiaceae bacterium]
GTSKARLYHYFPSKEALLFDALDRYTRRLAERVQAVAAQRLPPRAELTELVRTLMREYRDSRAYHVALLNDVKFLSPQQRERIKAQEREVVDALGRTLARVAPQRFGGPGSRPATMALLGMINFTFAWLRPDGPMTYEQYADLVVDLWLNGAVSPAAPIATPKPTIVSEPQ